jgi:hypothetical protein
MTMSSEAGQESAVLLRCVKTTDQRRVTLKLSTERLPPLLLLRRLLLFQVALRGACCASAGQDQQACALQGPQKQEQQQH